MSARTFLNDRVALHSGDCLVVVRSLPDASIDACVTDPPYALVSITRRFGADGAAAAKVPDGGSGAYARASAGFMGKTWDTGETAFAVEFWREVWRVLKPGAHVVAFGGTRSFHRLACAIEDAGFEIRDSLFWHFASGFPKSHNISRKLDETETRCSCPAHLRRVRHPVGSSDPISSCAQPDVLSGLQTSVDRSESRRSTVPAERADDGLMRGLRQGKDDPSGLASEGQVADVLATVQRGSARGRVGEARSQGFSGSHLGELCASGTTRSDERSLEGRRDISEAARELRQRPLCEVSARLTVNGADGWLRDGAPPSDGEADRSAAAPRRVRAPSRSRPAEQRLTESGTVAGQPEPQEWGAWPHCERCGKPTVPDGLGTALKPATEVICLARKPLVGTVAANVRKHGTGALNIDGCRIGEGGERKTITGGMARKANPVYGAFANSDTETVTTTQGRFPANILHDGSEEVLASFPLSGPASDRPRNNGDFKSVAKGAETAHVTYGHADGGGSAARFFFSAKADAEDRLGSKHPTVKPVDLMQWLVRLVTPPGGTVLDPFAGTGTTGEAAFREGFKAVLIEREPEYIADIERRMGLVLGGPDERRHAIVKARGLATDAGPLFSETAA